MIFKPYRTHFIIFFFSILVIACANQGQGPTGGKKDIIPPRVLRSLPLNNSLYFNKKQILIDFDEMVSVEKPAQNIIISPPQVKPPDVKTFGKRITVNFNEDLKDTTTYSIHFGNSIVDLNEQNPVKNYLFSFSTGGQIDTLSISGVVIDATNLNPLPGILVGIYLDQEDSVFSAQPFMRIGKTDEDGRFSVNNIKKGKYKIFALGDTNNDYYYQPGEGLAMNDSLLTPSFRREMMHDSIWKDSTHFDSIRSYMGTRFLPDDVVLHFFKENKKRQYFVKSERKNPYSFSFFFNSEAKQLPVIKPLNFNWEGKYLLQKNNTLDSLTYWLTDSSIWKIDTLQMAVSYLKSDSVMNLIPVIDTMNVFVRKGRVNPKAKATKIEPKVEPLKFNSNIAPIFEIYSPLSFKFDSPLASEDISKIKLSVKVDTIFKTIPFKWRQLDSTKTSFVIENAWTPDTSYKLEIDSAAFASIYKRVSNKYEGDFRIRSVDEYSSLKIFLAKFNPQAVLQVLDSKDIVLDTQKALEKGTIFKYLKPGDYFLRLFIDENENGSWDTGSLFPRKQPEKVYYFNEKFTLKANWEFEETWDYEQIPLLKQKPLELFKTNYKTNQIDSW